MSTGAIAGGYRRPRHPQKFRVWIIRQVRRITASIPLETKRRAAVHAMLPSLGYIPLSVEYEIAFAALRLISAGGTLFRRMRCARQPQSRMTNQKAGARSDRTDWTSRPVSFR
jgi:hypothetical protein